MRRNVKQWEGFGLDGVYNIALEENPPGTYFLMVGSDMDNDASICDAGEFCQLYPLNSRASEIVISGQDVQLGQFLMGFPDDNDDGTVSANSFDAVETIPSPQAGRVKTMIGGNGVRINKSQHSMNPGMCSLVLMKT